MKRMSVADAKAQFAEAVRAAEGGQPIVVTRYGSDVAAIVAVSDLAELKRLRAAKSAVGLSALAGGWEGSGDLVGEVDAVRRSRTLPR